MEKGRIIQKGTHDELIKEDGMYRQIFELQTRIDEELEVELSRSMVSE
jgi:ATP-binding cassette subfamily B protein